MAASTRQRVPRTARRRVVFLDARVRSVPKARARAEVRAYLRRMRRGSVYVSDASDALRLPYVQVESIFLEFEREGWMSRG